MGKNWNSVNLLPRPFNIPPRGPTLFENLTYPYLHPTLPPRKKIHIYDVNLTNINNITFHIDLKENTFSAKLHPFSIRFVSDSTEGKQISHA